VTTILKMHSKSYTNTRKIGKKTLSQDNTDAVKFKLQ